jgi:hypothetical protein
MDLSRCRVATQSRSLHVGFVVVHHKISELLGWATKPRPEARGRNGIQARQEASVLGETQRDHEACVGRMRIAAKAWLPDEKYQLLSIYPLRVVYLILCSRGSLVICPTRIGFMYIALGLDGNSSIQTTS